MQSFGAQNGTPQRAESNVDAAVPTVAHCKPESTGVTDMKRLHLVMPLQIFEPLTAIAKRDGRTISELIRQALLEFIAQQKS